MKFFSITLALGVALESASAKELPPLSAAQAVQYESGEVHNAIMARKMASFQRQRATGQMNPAKFLTIGKNRDFVPCRNGVAAVVPGDPMQTFRCNNIDFYDFVSHKDLGSATGEGSSSWGWTAPNGREFVAIGQADGAAFAEIDRRGKLIYLGRLPQFSTPIIWREIRGYKNYMVIGSEAVNHGVQIFDMTKLLNIDPKNPVTFSNERDLTGYFNELPIGRTHNIVVNEEKQYAVAVGAQPRNSTCAAGLIFIDLKDPSNPTTPGCAAGDGYVHDAQCLVYRGPHLKYYGRDICYGYNEDTLTIYDVTDKSTTNIISRTSYEGASYTHQGWVLDPNWQTHLVLDDELDEEQAAGPAASKRPITYFWDIRNLEAPKQTGIFRAAELGIDHNQFVIRGLSYQSNYGAGLRVLDVSSIPRDPSGRGVKEVAFFDIYPEDDAQGGVVDFVGTWSHYPFFKSGYIFVNTIERGAFVVKMKRSWWPFRK